MTDDAVTTRIDVFDPAGEPLDLHFQEYWVQRHAEDPVKGIRFDGIERAIPAPGVLDAIAGADVLLLCPSNPVVSIGPILVGARRARCGRGAVAVRWSASRRSSAARRSPGMADKLMPVAGLEVSALGAARAYRDLLSGWVIDERDADAAPAIADELGIAVAVTDTVMRDDDVAAAVAPSRRRAGVVTIEIWPVEGLPEIRDGDDLAAMLAEPLRALGARDGDVVAVTQKIVSKAEGRVVPDEGEGRSVWVTRETRRVVARRGRSDHRRDASRVRLRERRGGRVQRRGRVRVAPAGRSRRIRGGASGRRSAQRARALASGGRHHRHVRASLAQRTGERGDRVRRSAGAHRSPRRTPTITAASWRSRSSPSQTRWPRRADS